MNSQHGEARFWTTFAEDHQQGFAGVRLHRESAGHTGVAAEVIFWDAAGQFYVQTFGGDVPLAVMEALIAEAKAAVKTT